jgi:RNA polymerase sigma-70 factor (ECF subfamily)
VVALPPSRPSEELVARIALGDVAALRALYDLHGGRVLALARLVLRDEAEAEDVVQETFLEVWRRADRFDPRRGNVVAWVTTLARGRAIDRRRTRESGARTATLAAREAPPAATAPLAAVEARGDRDRVGTALAALPREQRVVVEDAYFEGLTLREISERRGEPLGTVKSRMRAALQKLGRLLAGDGGDP